MDELVDYDHCSTLIVLLLFVLPSVLVMSRLSVLSAVVVYEHGFLKEKTTTTTKIYFYC
jgi:hypothetical protein